MKLFGLGLHFAKRDVNKLELSQRRSTRTGLENDVEGQAVGSGIVYSGEWNGRNLDGVSLLEEQIQKREIILLVCAKWHIYHTPLIKSVPIQNVCLTHLFTLSFFSVPCIEDTAPCPLLCKKLVAELSTDPWFPKCYSTSYKLLTATCSITNLQHEPFPRIVFLLHLWNQNCGSFRIVKMHSILSF